MTDTNKLETDMKLLEQNYCQETANIGHLTVLNYTNSEKIKEHMLKALAFQNEWTRLKESA